MYGTGRIALSPRSNAAMNPLMMEALNLRAEALNCNISTFTGDRGRAWTVRAVRLRPHAETLRAEVRAKGKLEDLISLALDRFEVLLFTDDELRQIERQS